MTTDFDVVILGGGPSGLQAALSLGRARKRVLLCDAGPRRNAAAVGVNNFVTRDGIAPDAFRAEARAQLKKYPNVEVRDVRVERITGEKDDFVLDSGIRARRVLLATGMIDEPPALEGLAPLWGHFVFQCPYCHGWEARDARWGYVAPAGFPPQHLMAFVLQLRGWSNEVTLFVSALPDDVAATLRGAGVRLEQAPVKRLIGGERLTAVELIDGTTVACDALFMHPPQRQVPVVQSLGLSLDEEGFVKVDPMTRETSRSGIYAAGDLTTRLQAAVIAAAAGMQAAAMLNMELQVSVSLRGAARKS
ncbi:MAG: NAD(P)/FAD-dependent oxidoreductase [Myxococcaceae bacterium]